MKVRLLKRLRKEANDEFSIAVNGTRYEIWCKSLNANISNRAFWIHNLDEVMKVIRDLRREHIKKLVEELKLIRELKRKYKNENWRYSRTQKRG